MLKDGWETHIAYLKKKNSELTIATLPVDTRQKLQIGCGCPHYKLSTSRDQDFAGWFVGLFDFLNARLINLSSICTPPPELGRIPHLLILAAFTLSILSMQARIRLISRPIFISVFIMSGRPIFISVFIMSDRVL